MNVAFVVGYIMIVLGVATLALVGILVMLARLVVLLSDDDDDDGGSGEPREKPTETQLRATHLRVVGK